MTEETGACAPMRGSPNSTKWTSFDRAKRAETKVGGVAPAAGRPRLVIPVARIDDEYAWVDLLYPGGEVRRVETLADQRGLFDWVTVLDVHGREHVVLFNLNHLQAERCARLIKRLAALA